MVKTGFSSTALELVPRTVKLVLPMRVDTKASPLMVGDPNIYSINYL
jgi:hypothetical protein